MWRSVTPIILAGWVCVCVAAVSEVPIVKLYKKVGDDVVLKPGTPSGTITNIVWRDGLNIAVQWDGVEVDRYRQFGDRGNLNISSGELTIRGLTPNDSNVYTAEIDTKVASRTSLIVISPVPTPTVIKACDDEKTSCTLTCGGDTAGVEPVTYRWKSGDVLLTDLSMELRITKDSSDVIEFSCELENPVSRASSQPVPNPFAAERESTTPGNPNISTGVTVFVCLIAAVLLLGFIHRWKAGVWFYQKASMPWEADFWRRDERPQRQRQAGGSNGAAAHPEKGQKDEETLMT